MRFLPALLTRAVLVAGVGCLASAPAGAEPIVQIDLGAPAALEFADQPARSSGESTPESGADDGDEAAPVAQLPPSSEDLPTTPSAAAVPPSVSHRRAPRQGRTSDVVAGGSDALAASLAAPPLSELQEGSVWERELKEALRPIYDELAASGIVDAVQGIKSYLGLLNALAAHDRANSESATGDRSMVGESAAGLPGYGAASLIYDANGTALPAGKTAAQAERERMIAVLILSEWITAAKPWFFALLAGYALWHAIRFAVNYSRWKSRRARKRAARAQRSHGSQASQGSRRSTRRRGASA